MAKRKKCMHILAGQPSVSSVEQRGARRSDSLEMQLCATCSQALVECVRAFERDEAAVNGALQPFLQHLNRVSEERRETLSAMKRALDAGDTKAVFQHAKVLVGG